MYCRCGGPKSVLVAYMIRVLPEDYCKEDPCNFPWDGELAWNWPTFEQLCVQNLALAISYCFSPIRARTKSGWLDVDQELDMGCQLLTRTFPS